MLAGTETAARRIWLTNPLVLILWKKLRELVTADNEIHDPFPNVEIPIALDRRLFLPSQYLTPET